MGHLYHGVFVQERQTRLLDAFQFTLGQHTSSLDTIVLGDIGEDPKSPSFTHGFDDWLETSFVRLIGFDAICPLKSVTCGALLITQSRVC